MISGLLQPLIPIFTNHEPFHSFFCSASRIILTAYVPTDEDVDRITLDSSLEGEARICCKSKIIRLVRGETNCLAPDQGSLPTLPTFIFLRPIPIVIYVVNLSCNADDHQTPLYRPCVTSRGRSDFSKFIHTYNTYNVEHAPVHIIMIINLSGVKATYYTMKEEREQNECIESKRARIRLMTRYRELYIHYTRFLEATASQTADFILNSIENALNGAKRVPSEQRILPTPKPPFFDRLDNFPSEGPKELVEQRIPHVPGPSIPETLDKPKACVRRYSWA